MSLAGSAGRAIAGAAAVIGVLGGGYWLGQRDAAAAEQAALAALGLLAQTDVSEDARVAVEAARSAAAEGDFAAAAAALPSNVRPVRQTDCHPSGVVFAAMAGALVENCETGMTASVATVNTNRTVQATLGGKRISGSPGTAFAHPDLRYRNCFLVYLNLESGADAPTARMNFDCEKG